MKVSRLFLFLATLTALGGAACSDLSLPRDAGDQAPTEAGVVSTPGSPARRPSAESRFVGEVLDVHDGSTLTVLIGEVRERVRLIGVDAPELHQAPWGLQAFTTLRQLAMGKVATLETDKLVRDQNHRLLAYVYVDGAFVNLEMIRRGRAQVSMLPPNVAHFPEYLHAQAEAQQARVGLWETRDPLGLSLECLRTRTPGC